MDVQENELLTRVGPGTPMGELLRRYWWPVGFTQEVKNKPVPVRILCEDLILFRDLSGKLGLLDRFCAHRRVSLEFGRVEEQGIRCCYHGWKYDHKGQCIDTPLEPEDSRLKEGVRIQGYEVTEAGGLVFAYLGPKPVPEFPRYDLLYHDQGLTVVGADEEYCNWLQRAENAVDPLHLAILHAGVYPSIAFKRPRCEFEETWYGQRMPMWAGEKEPRVVHFVFPSHSRFTRARVGDTPSHDLRLRVPTDDTKTTTFWINTYPSITDQGKLRTEGLKKRERLVYEKVEDGYWDIQSHDQDAIAQESQGLITDRSREKLGTSDRGIALFRRALHQAIKDVQEGRDPLFVMRDRRNSIDFDASMEALGTLKAS
jgi:5,5'-dehydrodivanillate O-demethylase oxygenase subunit